MNLRQASFGELFGTAFAVGFAFDVALFVAGLVLAFHSPGSFKYNGGQAASSGQAIGVLVLFTLFPVIANLIVSAGGAALLVIARSVDLFRSKVSP